MPDVVPESVASAQDSEVGRYIQAAHLVKVGLTKAIKELKRARARAKIADKPWYTAEISQLREEFADVQRDLLAYLDEQISIAPPTKDQFNQVKKLAADLDTMIANAKAAKSIIAAAAKLADSVQNWS